MDGAGEAQGPGARPDKNKLGRWKKDRFSLVNRLREPVQFIKFLKLRRAEKAGAGFLLFHNRSYSIYIYGFLYSFCWGFFEGFWMDF